MAEKSDVFARYLDRVKSSVQRRRSESSPLIRVAIILGPALVCAFIVLAYFLGEDGNWEIQIDEFGAVNSLSAIFMAATSAFSFTAYLFHPSRSNLDRWFWLLAAAGFFYLSLDELLQFHEYAGKWIGASSVGAPDIFRNWNDVIVIGYAVIGLTAIFIFLPEVLRFKPFTELLAIGFVFGIVHTAIDSLFAIGETKTIVEESFKLLAMTFFALAMLSVVVTMSIQSRSGLAERSSRLNQ